MATNEILPLLRTPDDKLKRIPGRQDRRRRASVPFATQSRRLGATMGKAFSDILDRRDIDVAGDPAALAPERALVLEIIGSPKNFVNAARKVGLEWLAEEVAILHGVNEYFDTATDLDDEGGDEGEEDEGDHEEDDAWAALDEHGSVEADPRDDGSSGTLYLGMPPWPPSRSCATCG